MLGKQTATIFKMASCCSLVPFDFAKISLLQCLKGFQYADQLNDWDRTAAEKELPENISSYSYNSLTAKRPGQISMFLWKLLHPRNLVHILLWSLLIAEEARDVFWGFDILIRLNHVGCLVGRTIFMPNYVIVIGREWKPKSACMRKRH